MIERYNELAGQFGWLPINISIMDSSRILLDAAERASGCFPEVSEGIKNIIKSREEGE